VNDFNLWFSTGLAHIADWQAYDHILFLIVLCGVYTLREIKKILVLITSFTIGHSITLALSVLSILSIKSQWIEFLIPITILFTAALNLYFIRRPSQKNFNSNYFFALLFGCIHGMGFSLLLRSLLGKTESIIQPLFAFNLGLEVGQVIIILAILLIFASLNLLVKVEERDKKFFISSVAFGIATIMALERLSILINS
jgi:hypothetical protein